MKQYVLAFIESLPGRITHTRPGTLAETRSKAAVEIAHALKRFSAPGLTLGNVKVTPGDAAVRVAGKYWKDGKFVGMLAKGLGERKSSYIEDAMHKMQISLLGLDVQ